MGGREKRGQGITRRGKRFEGKEQAGQSWWELGRRWPGIVVDGYEYLVAGGGGGGDHCCYSSQSRSGKK